MTDPAAHAAHSPVPPAPAEPQGSVLWTCADADCEWTATNLLPEVTRMSSYAQHLVAAVALTTPAAPAAAPATPAASSSASIVDAALLARAEALQVELDASHAELEHLRGMMRPMAVYLDQGFSTPADVPPPAPQEQSSATAQSADRAADRAASQDAPTTAAAPSVSDMLDVVDGVVRTAADVVDTAWPVLSKMLRGAAR